MVSAESLGVDKEAYSCISSLDTNDSIHQLAHVQLVPASASSHKSCFITIIWPAIEPQPSKHSKPISYPRLEMDNCIMQSFWAAASPVYSFHKTFSFEAIMTALTTANLSAGIFQNHVHFTRVHESSKTFAG